MIDFADGGKPFGVNRRLPGSHLGRVAPDVPDFFDGKVFTRDVAVE